jgi:fumarate reductase subunit D
MENNPSTDQNQVVAEVKNTEPETQSSDFTFNEQTILAALSYLNLLILIPYFVKRNDPFVHFHIKQGVVLLIPELIVYVVSGIFYFLWPVWNILWLAFTALTIIGILHAVTKKQKALPVIGHFAEKVNI